MSVSENAIGARARLTKIAMAVGAALVPTVALAHGNVTGIEDVWQDYGLAIFLAFVVVIGAGVLAWVLLAPLPTGPVEDAPRDPAPVDRTGLDLDEARRVHDDDRRPT